MDYVDYKTIREEMTDQMMKRLQVHAPELTDDAARVIVRDLLNVAVGVVKEHLQDD